MPIKPLTFALLGAFLISILISGSSGPTNLNAENSRPSQQAEVFYPAGPANRNLPIFQYVLETSGAGTSAFDLAAAISALVKTGFDLDSIVHTATKTKTGQPAESVSLAISFKGKCLIGQFSQAWLIASVEEETESGCLVGDFEKASQLEMQQDK
jgi:hypothetical protein